MDRTTSASHPNHDEMLIARFYGGDVDDSERARAIELMVDCADCADLFADLGAISEASSAMPVPARPRDFTLTEEDAARLRSKRRAWKAIFGLGLRRSLGGSLAALGLAGLMLASAASLLGQTTNVSLTSLNSAPERLAASNAPNFGAQGALGVTVASPASASQAIPAAPPQPRLPPPNPPRPRSPGPANPSKPRPGRSRQTAPATRAGRGPRFPGRPWRAASTRAWRGSWGSPRCSRSVWR